MIDRKILEQTMQSFMYRHPIRRGLDMRRFVAIVLVVVAVLTIPIATTLLPAKNVSASLFPKVIDGYVRDLGGTPVQGANVTVRSYDGATLKGTQYYTPLSGANGFYTVTFEMSQWEIGYTITVDVKKGLDTGTNSTVANDEAVQTMNATLNTFIPEFSTYLPIIGGSLVIVAVLAVRSAKKR